MILRVNKYFGQSELKLKGNFPSDNAAFIMLLSIYVFKYILKTEIDFRYANKISNANLDEIKHQEEQMMRGF
jgi:hypothetical protein